MFHFVMNHRAKKLVTFVHERPDPVRILETAARDDFGLNDQTSFRHRDGGLQIAQRSSQQRQADDADVLLLFGNIERCPAENADANGVQALREIEPLTF